MKRLCLRFNAGFERYTIVITPLALVIGFLLAKGLQPYTSSVSYLFAYITFAMALGCGFGHLGSVLRKPGIIVWTIMLAHLVAPAIAYGIGAALFGQHSPYVIGLVLFTIIPLGVSSVMWTGLSGGNVPLMLAMVILDSALSPLVVPAGIRLLFHQAVAVRLGPLMLDLLLIIVLPTFAGVLLHQLTRGRIQAKVQPYASSVSKLCFAAVVMLNAAAIQPYVQQMKGDMALVVSVVVGLVALCYALGYIGTYWLGSREMQATVSYATGMRNISLGIVLAIGYFPPLAAVPVILSILVQQPLATVFNLVLQKLNNTSSGETGARHVG
ncbi:bile acid:sodium symporter family protein [Paenibacillus protaetiae]|uniref:Bile acid:sodium symporter family protein n=1 Tax=Paenibacillus protaetiae TaxID=2509456 RepID=A0A4P6EXV7_9BACL|nr:bile acid:sodium symporter family protein [Paenibacillus protaetiae]QAY66589.1 bile acid:sodium symporter family protein [Paenibacillus protaetiae]